MRSIFRVIDSPSLKKISGLLFCAFRKFKNKIALVQFSIMSAKVFKFLHFYATCVSSAKFFRWEEVIYRDNNSKQLRLDP